MPTTLGLQEIDSDMTVRERIRRIMDLRREAGKFTKAEAYYVDEAFQKPIRCGNCQFYDGENSTCDLVSEEGNPGPGRISRLGACSLFNARPPRITALQWLWGRAGRQGIAPERARATAFMFVYSSLKEEPPQEIADKSIISMDRIKRLMPRR